eukprot:CAMPEP_0206215358 /NCGR_PEP_ID=MMETSP0047_2-20121206/2152_1 /ASSEMBLY_ACC=CAM_ASM_000192 /TAXON_ID=195065 /ORGANISM="Chroomonas mesostigmatica_cf, Strain CCMP1168" /LENGTH=93 /DNA_ID=CAMNT_0053637647 /DNA_START=306 /DNA_END=584 /DNA_ORIENTATION=+
MKRIPATTDSREFSQKFTPTINFATLTWFMGPATMGTTRNVSDVIQSLTSKMKLAGTFSHATLTCVLLSVGVSSKRPWGEWVWSLRQTVHDDA